MQGISAYHVFQNLFCTHVLKEMATCCDGFALPGRTGWNPDEIGSEMRGVGGAFPSFLVRLFILFAHGIAYSYRFISWPTPRLSSPVPSSSFSFSFLSFPMTAFPLSPRLRVSVYVCFVPFVSVFFLRWALPSSDPFPAAVRAPKL